MTITATEARKRLFPLINKVNDDQVPVEIVARTASAVLISKSEYESLVETAHLLRSPANAQRLFAAIAEVEAGKIEHHELIENAE